MQRHGVDANTTLYNAICPLGSALKKAYIYLKIVFALKGYLLEKWLLLNLSVLYRIDAAETSKRRHKISYTDCK